MPLASKTISSAGKIYGRPFEGAVEHRAQVTIDVTALTSAEVDSKGYLKPGVPFRQVSAGVAGLVNAAAQVIFGVSIETIKVANGNAAGDLSGASTAFPIALATICQVRRGIIEDNLGRVLSANELAAFVAAGRNPVLLG